MNYVYNVGVNLKDKLYNFYEWNSEDIIERFNKLEVFNVDDKTYDDILKMRIKVNKVFIYRIKNNKLTCIFTNDIDTICVRFDMYGEIKQISKLDLEEESEILSEINIKDKYSLEYELIDKSNNYSFNTREEDRIIEYINNYLIDNKNNEELIDYLYSEWFSDNNCKNKYERLINSINSEYSINHKKLFDIIKILV